MSKSKLYSFELRTLSGKPISLAQFEGKALLLVNVASKCGLTPQYEALERIYERYRDRGFEVLGFPANNFGEQEPGTHEEIQNFCTSNFGVKFPLFEKISVKGSDQHPLYAYLTATQPQATLNDGPSFEEKLRGYGITREKKDDILWNFEKFLVNKKGEIIARFSPDMVPDSPVITRAIEAVL